MLKIRGWILTLALTTSVPASWMRSVSALTLSCGSCSRGTACGRRAQQAVTQTCPQVSVRGVFSCCVIPASWLRPQQGSPSVGSRALSAALCIGTPKCKLNPSHLGQQGQDGDARVAADDGDCHGGGVHRQDLPDELLRPHHVQLGDAQQLPGVISACSIKV